MKYWLISYFWRVGWQQWHPDMDAITSHPLQWAVDRRFNLATTNKKKWWRPKKTAPLEAILFHYREITKKEYDEIRHLKDITRWKEEKALGIKDHH